MPDALMMRLLRSGMLAPPNHLDPPHQCCWIVDDGYEQCGLWCGHDGDHIPYTPGIYLPPPVIDPLTVLSVLRHRWGSGLLCPLCGARVDWPSREGPYRVHRDDGTVSWFEPGDDPGSVELTWRFEPCGCEGRELLPSFDPAGE